MGYPILAPVATLGDFLRATNRSHSRDSIPSPATEQRGRSGGDRGPRQARCWLAGVDRGICSAAVTREPRTAQNRHSRLTRNRGGADPSPHSAFAKARLRRIRDVVSLWWLFFAFKPRMLWHRSNASDILQSGLKNGGSNRTLEPAGRTSL